MFNMDAYHFTHDMVYNNNSMVNMQKCYIARAVPFIRFCIKQAFASLQINVISNEYNCFIY